MRHCPMHARVARRELTEVVIDRIDLATEAVDQRWDTYEEMATRGAHQFPADARKER